MSTFRPRFLVAMIALLLVTAPVLLGADMPFLTGRVVDDANVVSEAARQRLSAMLKAHEDATTNQVVVLTVPTIGSQSVEEYAVKVFETWKLGQKNKDNGVLVVVVPNDRKMRIEVGYGLEGTLPDGAAGGIIRTWMTPAFKAGDYDKGIEDGVAAVIARLEGHAAPAGRTPLPEAPSTGSNGFAKLSGTERLLIGAFIYGIIGLFTVIGVMTPIVGWFLYVFLIPFWAIFPMVIIGPRNALIQLAVYLVAFPAAKRMLKDSQWEDKAATPGSRGKRSKTTGGFSTSSSSWSSSSSSGSSFSGGGGSSGGGGASGSW